MVRIKHRYLLLHILYPDAHKSTDKTSNPAYLGFHAPSPAHVSVPLLLSHLRNSIAVHFGDCGLGLTAGSLKVVYLSHATSTAIIRCPRQYFRIVWAALTYMNDLPGPRRGDAGKPCVIQVVRVSGTIRKSEEELLRRARQDLVRAKAFEDHVESGVIDSLTAQRATPSVRAAESIEDPDEDDDLDDTSD